MQSSAGSSDPDGTITACSWNFGDGATSTAANPSHTYASAGNCVASLTVTDNAGATASASTTIQVTSSTAQTLRSTAINFTASLSGGNVAVAGPVVVKDNKNAASSGATVKVTWTKPNGNTLNQTATTDANGKAGFGTSDGCFVRVHELGWPDPTGGFAQCQFTPLCFPCRRAHGQPVFCHAACSGAAVDLV